MKLGSTCPLRALEELCTVVLWLHSAAVSYLFAMYLVQMRESVCVYVCVTCATGRCSRALAMGLVEALVGQGTACAPLAIRE